MLFKNIVAFVTGGSSGLGKNTIKFLLNKGAKAVVLFDLPTSKGNEVAKQFGERCKFIPGDVSEEHDVKNAMDFIKNEYQLLNTVVNCAGISFAYKTNNFLKDTYHSSDDFKKILLVNTLGAFNVAKFGAGLIAQTNKTELEFEANLTAKSGDSSQINHLSAIRNFSTSSAQLYSAFPPYGSLSKLPIKNLSKAKYPKKSMTDISNMFYDQPEVPIITKNNNDENIPNENIMSTTLEKIYIESTNTATSNILNDMKFENNSQTNLDDLISPSTIETNHSSTMPKSVKTTMDMGTKYSKKSNSSSQFLNPNPNPTNIPYIPTNQRLPCTKEKGVIILTAASFALNGEGGGGQVAYTASKGAISAMIPSLCRDFADAGIRVCAIAPGYFDTPLTQHLPERVINMLADNVPYPNRLGHPDDFAQLVGHIIENKYLNGTVINLNGGFRNPL